MQVVLTGSSGFMQRGRVDAVIHAGALHQPDIARHAAQAFIDVNVVSAPTPFERLDVAALGTDAPGVITRRFPDVDFAAVLKALRDDASLPFVHDPAYVSPVVGAK